MMLGAALRRILGLRLIFLLILRLFLRPCGSGGRGGAQEEASRDCSAVVNRHHTASGA